jgi:3-dehydroquinate synthase
VNEPPTLVRVALGRASYEIEIGSGSLSRAGDFVAARRKASHAVIITDEHVHSPHAERVAAGLTSAGLTVDLLVIEPGEESKSVPVANHLWQKMLELGADRKSVVVAVGGGVTGDLAGFVAATFARGLAFVQVPTTLLAMVDSAVGGKVGVNLPSAKNMVGAFWQPIGVLIDTDTLATLPDRELCAGLAEVVKYGVILDNVFFEWLERNAELLLNRDPAALRYAISHSCRLKGDVVERDEREETGLRAVLNYGHTFAHAIEATMGYGELLHGEAVSIGMICAAQLAQRLGRVDSEFSSRQQRLLARLGLPTELPGIAESEMLAAMSRDKKVEFGQLRFVLPTRLGHVELVGRIDQSLVRSVLQDGAA